MSLDLDTSDPGCMAAMALRLRAYLQSPADCERLHRQWFQVLPVSGLSRLLVATRLEILQAELSSYARIH